MEKSETVRSLLILSFLMAGAGFAAEKTDPAPLQNYSVGEIPYSNQWEYDRPRSFFLLGASRLQLTSENIKINNEYIVDLQTTSPFFGTLSYFTELTRLGSTHFSIMGQYQLGATLIQSDLSPSNFQVSDTGRKSSWMMGFMSAGAYLNYEFYSVVDAFLGPRFLMNGYRHSSSLGGAERDGVGFYGEAVAGLMIEGIFGRGALYAEAALPYQLSDQMSLLSKKLSYSLGAGMSF